MSMSERQPSLLDRVIRNSTQVQVRLRVTLRDTGFRLFFPRRPRIEALRSGFDRLIAPSGPWKVSVSRWSPVVWEAPFHTFAKLTSKEKM